MPNSKIKTLTIVLTMISVSALLFLVKPSLSAPGETEASLSDVSVAKPSIATQWQWEPSQNDIEIPGPTTTEHSNLPFTAQSVYNALQAVTLDSDGNIILNHDALISLDEALERIHTRLNQNSLTRLQDLIKKHLPNKAGEQTAALVEDYYHFLEAKEEFSQINEAMANTENEPPRRALEINEQLYSELQSLREVYLGYETTQSLFRVSDANAEYMFASMKLALNDTLTDDEKIQQRIDIESRHLEQSINIDNWPTRFRAFKNEKSHIVSSSNTDEEKQNQLRDLLRQHFTNDEIERIEYLELDKLNSTVPS